MPKDSNSAILMSRRSHSGFDIDTYRRCKPFLHDRDSKLAAVIAREATNSLTGKSQFRILDVGTGDGSLLKSISTKLEQSALTPGPRVSISVTSIDPSPWRTGVQSDLERLGMRVQFLCGRIEDVLDHTGSYDQIYCSHVLYHIRRAKWRSLIDGLLAHLAPSGSLVVALASKASEIYSVWLRLQTSCRFASFDRQFEEDGFEYYAEDFEKDLGFHVTHGSVHDVALRLWNVSTVVGRIGFSQRQLGEAEAFLRGAVNDSAVIQFLAFLFRVRQSALVNCGDVLKRELAMASSNGSCFQHADRVFVYRG